MRVLRRLALRAVLGTLALAHPGWLLMPLVWIAVGAVAAWSVVCAIVATCVLLALDRWENPPED